MTERLDGKKLSETLREQIAAGVTAFRAQVGRVPGLEVVLVGTDPASQVYVRNKAKACEAAGIRSVVHRLPETTSQTELLGLVSRLAGDSTVDGILVQLPLPRGLDEEGVTEAIPASKDVDGFHPLNVGLLSMGRGSLVPCTPRGCMRLLAAAGIEPAGKRALVIGRSNIVGKPIATLLLQAHATVTIAHSRSKELPALCREADIVVAALGKPEFVQGSWLKPGAIVLDVGINRLADGKLVGDVHSASALGVAGYLSPVPGGVGPMTIACLLENTLRAAWKHAGLDLQALGL